MYKRAFATMLEKEFIPLYLEHLAFLIEREFDESKIKTNRSKLLKKLKFWLRLQK